MVKGTEGLNFSQPLTKEDLHGYREAAHYCQPIGRDRFKEKIEEKLGKPVGHTRRGRPKLVKL